MDAQEALYQIQDLLGKGKTLSEIVSENPELVLGLDLFHQKLREAHIRASIAARISRTGDHALARR